MSVETRRTYRSRVRMYLAWLADHAATYTSDPLAHSQARDWAVRDYRMWLLRDGPAKRSRVYVNSALTALDDLHTRLGLGKVNIGREELPKSAPRALEERARIRRLRAVEAHLSPRDRCIASIPYYVGARISEVVRLDVGDVLLSARKAACACTARAASSARSTSTPSSASSCSSGSTNAPTGPTPTATELCSSTPRADG
ncbi:hypothetical protein [Streptosporangium roseum]|uniref:hypothetical protein n=1 Tax=Streptosporangium roseum TaxID=2001 RepID=UPI00068C11BC|nr:hypothetical protein [Streptosporangium roseum]